MSHGLIVVPRSLRMFQRERRSNKPASAGGFTQHLECAPRVPDSATSASEAAQSDCAFRRVRSQSVQFVRC
jgi:hypothetical protein